MRIDGGLMGDLSESGRQAKRLEGLGYHGALTAETAHDPFFPFAACCTRDRIDRAHDIHRGGFFANADEPSEHRSRP